MKSINLVKSLFLVTAITVIVATAKSLADPIPVLELTNVRQCLLALDFLSTDTSSFTLKESLISDGIFLFEHHTSVSTPRHNIYQVVSFTPMQTCHYQLPLDDARFSVAATEHSRSLESFHIHIADEKGGLAHLRAGPKEAYSCLITRFSMHRVRIEISALPNPLAG